MPNVLKAAAMPESVSGLKAAYCVICLKLYTSSVEAALHSSTHAYVWDNCCVHYRAQSTVNL